MYKGIVSLQKNLSVLLIKSLPSSPAETVLQCGEKNTMQPTMDACACSSSIHFCAVITDVCLQENRFYSLYKIHSGFNPHY